MQRKRIGTALVGGVLSEIANKIFPLLILHLVATRLGNRGFGLSQFAQWLLDFAIFFITFGYPSAGMVAWRNTSPEDRTTLFSSVVLLRLTHAVAASVALFLALAYNPGWGSYSQLVTHSIFVLFTSALDGAWVITALRRLHWLSMLSILSKTLSLVAIFFLVQGADDANVYTVVTMGANALIGLGSFGIVLRSLGWKWPSKAAMWKTFLNSLPFALSFMLLVSLERFDLGAVEYWLGAEGVGIYGGPAKIAQSLIPIAGMVSTVFFAEMISIFDRDATMRHLRAGLRVSLVCLMPIVVGVWFVDEQIVSLILGQNTAGSAYLLSVLTLSILAHLFLLVFGNQILALSGKIHAYNLALAIGLVTGLILAFYPGIIEKNLMGIAVASVAGRWLSATIIFYLALRFVKDWRGVFFEMVKASIPAVVMFLALKLANLRDFSAIIIVGATVYTASTAIVFHDTLRRGFAVVRKRMD